MMKEKVFAVIDTETLGGATEKYCPCYHLGAVALSRTKEYSKINIIILENLKLTSAFYGKFKAEYYKNLLKNPTSIICYTEEEAKGIFSAWLKTNNVSCVCAYNSGFDFEKTLVKECIENLNFFDIWFAFLDTIGHYRKYNNFCVENGYVTPAGNLRMTAEIVFRFISGNDSFVEEHTALSDAEIEAEILKSIWKTHRGFTRDLHKSNRRWVNVKAKA